MEKEQEQRSENNIESSEDKDQISEIKSQDQEKTMSNPEKKRRGKKNYCRRKNKRT